MSESRKQKTMYICANRHDMQRPATNEYKSYFQRYIDLVPEGDIVDIMKQNAIDAKVFFEGIPEDKHNYSYAPGKWMLKQVLMHIMDTERGMSYRAFVGARGDKHTRLFTMEEDLYAANADVSGRTIEDLLEEFAAIRTATVKLFANITDAQSTDEATMEDGTRVTPRAIGYILVGHLLHHINVIKERYL